MDSNEELMREWRENPTTQMYLRQLVAEVTRGERGLIDRARTGDLGPAFVPDIARLAGAISGVRLALNLAGAK